MIKYNTLLAVLLVGCSNSPPAAAEDGSTGWYKTEVICPNIIGDGHTSDEYVGEGRVLVELKFVGPTAKPGRDNSWSMADREGYLYSCYHCTGTCCENLTPTPACQRAKVELKPTKPKPEVKAEQPQDEDTFALVSGSYKQATTECKNDGGHIAGDEHHMAFASKVLDGSHSPKATVLFPDFNKSFRRLMTVAPNGRTDTNGVWERSDPGRFMSLLEGAYLWVCTKKCRKAGVACWSTATVHHTLLNEGFSADEISNALTTGATQP